MKVLVKMVHGSHLYGLNTETSDLDYKGVYLPDQFDMLAGFKPEVVDESTNKTAVKNSKNDVDSQLYPLQKFLGMLAVGDMVALDMLHVTPEHVLESSPEWEWLQANKHFFYTKNMTGLLGYVKKQAARYGVRGSRVAALENVKVYLEQYKPTQRLKETQYQVVLKDLEHVEVSPGWLTVVGKRFSEGTLVKDVLYTVNKTLDAYGSRAKLAAQNEGVDWKAVSHALRAAYQLEEMFTTGDLKYPLKDREYLLQVKQGKLDFLTEVAPELERAVDMVQSLSETSEFKDKVSKDTLVDVVKAMYRG